MSSQWVADISEFALIDRLRDALPPAARGGECLAVAIGDDAAVTRITPGEHLVVSTDTLNEGVHFRLDWTTWADLGHKALAVNLSDLAAMGASPILATVNLSLTGAELVADLVEMYGGLGALAARTGTVVAGGDVTRSPAGVSITVTAIGETVSGAVLRRNRGQPGDQIWVTGTIGAAAAGLRLLKMGSDDPRRTATTAEQLIAALHRPEPRIAAGIALLEAGVRCAIDLSDGLAGDLHKLIAASEVDAEIELERLPAAAAVRALFRDEAIDLAVTGGDDYELLFTAPVQLTESIEDALRNVGVAGSIVGRLIERASSGTTLTGFAPDGSAVAIGATSFDHFRPAQHDATSDYC